MNLKEFSMGTGISLNHIGRTLSISKMTLFKIIREEPVAQEVADKIELFTHGLVMPKRSKKVYVQKQATKKEENQL